MSPGATFLVKWILVPAALAATGYFFVGPRIGGPVAERAAKKIKRSGIAPHQAVPAPATGVAAGNGDDVLPNPDTTQPETTRSTRPTAPPAVDHSQGPQISVAVSPANVPVDSPSATENRPDSPPAAQSHTRRRHHPRSTAPTPPKPSEKSAEPTPTEDPAGVGAGVP